VGEQLCDLRCEVGVLIELVAGLDVGRALVAGDGRLRQRRAVIGRPRPLQRPSSR
jgi:hypothetical protein